MSLSTIPSLAMAPALPTRWRAPLGAVLLAAAVLPAQAQDANLARNLAATCANCHGTNGQARAGEMVALAGRPAAATVALMGAFKAGQVPAATIMHQIAKGYTDEQIRLIAGYFEAQKPAAK
jgi:cytochrome subunit of sulfide dehydrogenase